jgi:hypothetical protein
VILWRGSAAWWKQPGGVVVRSREGDTPTETRIEYGRVRLSVNGDEVTLGGNNLLCVDQVDSPGGPKVVRAFRIDSRMPGSAGQIGSMLGQAPQVLPYLQCDARTGNPTFDAQLASMCLTNLGRR